MSELRWNPLLGEWVTTAREPDELTSDPCRFCDGEATPEPLLAETFDIAVLQSALPSLQPDPREPAVEGTNLYLVQPARGVSEHVFYSADHAVSLEGLPSEKLERLIRVWSDRSEAIGRRSFVRYVFVFEERGGGGHPHASIYGYPFIPAQTARALACSRDHFDRNGRCLGCDVLGEEQRDGRRVVLAEPGCLAYVPFFARTPNEVHVSPLRHVQTLSELGREETRDLAKAIHAVIGAYGELDAAPRGYSLAVHQRPYDGQDYTHHHLRIELSPGGTMRSCHDGTGACLNIALPEESAAELRARLAQTD